MRVSTTGEDSPQCIHDTPTSDPVPHPRHLNESCRSLNYALTHIGNDTLIVIGCGIHVLAPVDSLLEGTPLMKVPWPAIEILGNCENDIPRIQCTNGANLVFYNAEVVVVEYLDFQDCGEQLQHSDSLSDSSTLYFQGCKTVMIHHILISITGPFGRGISFIRYNTSITPWVVLLDSIEIGHYGIHGSGIHFEVFTGRTSNASQVSEEIQITHLHVINDNVQTVKFNSTMTFTGINITVLGDGEGGEITVKYVIVSLDSSTRANGISVALLDAVRLYTVTLAYTVIKEECQILRNSSNSTASGAFDEQPPNVAKSAASNSITHSIVKIELKGISNRNSIQIGTVYVRKCRLAPGNAFSIEVTCQSEENSILLHGVDLRRLGSNSSDEYSRGLQVTATGWAKRNKIVVISLLSAHHKTLCGAGGYFEFSGHAMENSMQVVNSEFFHNHALRGGGITVICSDYATQNTFRVRNTQIYDCFAEQGGGIYLLFQDSTSNNSMQFVWVIILNNSAHCGGGIVIQIRDASVANLVVTLYSSILFNKLLPSDENDMMGGGVHVEFATVSANFQTNNSIAFKKDEFGFNSAEQGVGGGVSVLYKHSLYEGNSGDSVTLNNLTLLHNMAASGSAYAFQSMPTHGKRLFRGIKLISSISLLIASEYQRLRIKGFERPIRVGKPLYYLNYDLSADQSLLFLRQQLSQGIHNPTFQVETSTNMIFAKSVQIVIDKTLDLHCGASAQGIYALDSEIVFQDNGSAFLDLCIASHGGAIALHGESYIRVGKKVNVVISTSHAFQRGGGIYGSSAPGVLPMSNCFVQYDLDWEENSGAFVFIDNSATAEGRSLYVSDARSCISQNARQNVTINMLSFPDLDFITYAYTISVFDILHFNFTFFYHGRFISFINVREPWTTLQWDINFGPTHVAAAGDTSVVWSKNLTIHFIPGKQKRLPYTHAYDEFGSTIRSVFTVLINWKDGSIPIELDSFSKYTADFTVILHGIPQRHGMAKHSFPTNTGNTSAVVTLPQLVLQSMDNTDLLLVMNIELQCCPPGYILRYGSGDMGTCHCGIRSLIGIAKCNESHPDVIGAVLERDNWAGYLPSNDQHSCDGQKFFTGQCPPGYCQTQQITLPHYNSQQGLQEVVCTGSNRKGLLCGDCLEGNGVSVNFNGIRPVCVSCEEGLSKVGILVWILSEWVPMLAFMFVLMLFNIDLVSGRFNSFLLFAQLLAFSTIRGDAELGPVHNAFVRIYRFLYGTWNLEFFGVLLPLYCLTPYAHLTLLQTILLHYSIGLFPLTVAITLTVLERSAEKWICCHRVDQCLRRMRRWKAKCSDGMSYDRALPAFVILGFTRFLVSSSYILVNQTITGEGGERKVVVWWQGSVPYGSIQHIAYFIPATVILLVFVLLPSFVLLTLPIGPQLFGRLLIAVPPLRKLQKMQIICSNIYTDRWVYHFVNVLQGCYKERFRSFSSLYLFHRIAYLFVAVFIPRVEDALRIQIFLIVTLLLLIATLQPYNSRKLNALDTAVLGNLALILILSLHITDRTTPIGTRQFFASIQMILIYLPLLYPGILLGRKVYLKCKQLRCCQKQEEQSEDNAEPLLEAPAERLGNLVLITELRAGVPTSEDDDTVTETETETHN